MAVPTISSVSPAAGHSGGKTLVEITGTNFRLPTAPPAVNGITPEAEPSLLVTFGGTAAKRVDVLSTTRAYVLTPIGDPSDTPIDVVVTNLDADGAEIPGETATLASVWRFVRPDVTDERSDLVRLVDAFVAELKRQITPNVVWPEDTDYDGDTGDTLSVTEVPAFPGLIVAATELADNAFYSERSKIEVENPDDSDGFIEMEPPVTVDLVFTVVGVSDNTKELLNLAAVTKRFFRKNPYLTMARDPDDSSKGEVSYEMNAEDAPNVRIKTEATTDNVKTFAITARVLGFDIETMHGIRNPDGTPVTGPGGATEAATDVGRTADGVTVTTGTLAIES